MRNPNETIYAGLTGDTALKAKVPTVYHMYPEKADPAPPFIVYEVLDNIPAMGADDGEVVADITVTVDIIHADRLTLSAILLDIDRVMSGLGYVRDGLGPLLKQVGGYSRQLRFKTELEV